MAKLFSGSMAIVGGGALNSDIGEDFFGGGKPSRFGGDNPPALDAFVVVVDDDEEQPSPARFVADAVAAVDAKTVLDPEINLANEIFASIRRGSCDCCLSLDARRALLLSIFVFYFLFRSSAKVTHNLSI